MCVESGYVLCSDGYVFLLVPGKLRTYEGKTVDGVWSVVSD
jgi:hypothetical protein